MTAVERIDSRLAELHRRYAELTKGKAAVPSAAAKIATKIEELKRQKADMAANERHSLGSLLPKDVAQRNEIYRMLIKLPIIADFMYAACVELRGQLEKLGLNELTITDRVRRMKQDAQHLAFTLSEFPELEKILSGDDMLIDALGRKVDSYLERRMNITE